MNRVLIATVAALVGVAGGYALALARGNADGRAAPRGLETARKSVSAPFEYQAPAPAISAAEARDHRDKHYEALETVDEVLDLPTDFAQTEALYTLAGRANAQQLEELIHQADNITHRYDRSAALGILFSRYAELDAPAAVAFFQELDLDIDDMIAQSLFSAWAKQDLAGAIAGCNALANVRVRKRAGYMILTAVARNDPGMLESVAQQLVDHHDTTWIESEMVGIQANYQPADALAQALQMNMHRGGQDAIGRVAVVWARNDPAAALAYASNIENQMQRQAFISSVVGRWMSDDPDVALQAILALPAGQDKNRALISGLSVYARADPQAALRMADSLDGATRLHAYQRVFFSWAEADPDTALVALAGLDDRTLRDSTLQTVIRTLAASDPEKALRYTQTLDENTRSSLLPSLLSQFTQSDPQRAIELARGVQARDERARNLYMVLQQLAHSNPGLAAQHIDELPSRDYQQQLYSQVAAAMMASSDAAAALAWAQTLSGEAYGSAVGAVGRMLAQTDPDRAAMMLGQVSGQAREAWIVEVTNAYARTDPRRALSWASQFKDEAGYANAVASAVHQLSRTDPQAALRAADDLPIEARQHTVSLALSGWAERDPRAAARWAQGADEAVRMSAVSAVTERWSQQDPAAAERWAMTLRGDPRDRALMTLAANSDVDWSQRARLVNAISSDQQREQSVFMVYQVTRRQQGSQQADALLDALDASDEVRARLRASQY